MPVLFPCTANPAATAALDRVAAVSLGLAGWAGQARTGADTRAGLSVSLQFLARELDRIALGLEA